MSTKTKTGAAKVDADKASRAQRPGLRLTATEKAVRGLRAARVAATDAKDLASAATKAVFALIGADNTVLVDLPSGDVLQAKAYETRPRAVDPEALRAAGVPDAIVDAVTTCKVDLAAFDALADKGVIPASAVEAATSFGDPVPNVNLTILPVTVASAD